MLRSASENVSVSAPQVRADSNALFVSRPIQLFAPIGLPVMAIIFIVYNGLLLHLRFIKVFKHDNQLVGRVRQGKFVRRNVQGLPP